MNFDKIWSGWKLGAPKEAASVEGGDKTRAVMRKNEQFNRTKRVMVKVYELDPGLFYGIENIHITEEKIEELVSLVGQELNGTPYKQAHNFLSKGLFNGCEQLGWQLPVPPPIHNRFIEQNQLTPEDYERLHELDQIIIAHEKRGLSQYADYRSPEWVFGRFVFSLITEGGLLNKHWLSKLNSAVRSEVGMLEGRVYITLNEKRASSSNHEDLNHTFYRRVFLGPTSQLTLFRSLKNINSLHYMAKNPADCLKEYVANICPNIKLPKDKLIDFLIETSITASLHTIPGYLVHYSRSRNVSISLDPETWHRLTTGHINHENHNNNENNDDLNFNTSFSINANTLHTGASSSNQSVRFSEIHSLLQTHSSPGNTGRKIVKDNLYAFLSASHLNSPIVQAIGLWTLHLLTHGGVQKSTITLSTIKGYIGKSGIYGRYLTSLASHHEDLSALRPDQWGEIYENILLTSKSDGNHYSKSWALNQFHNFLRQNYDDIPDIDIGSSKRQESRVDNNIITPAEYIRAIDIIQRSDQGQRFKMMQQLALMLGYRCGFRRSEIQHLSMADMHCHLEGLTTDLETWIRNGKTESATRRVPLEHLALSSEKSELIQWLRLREGESPSSSLMRELLFCLPGQYRRPLSDLELFSPITKALKVASGTYNVRFHHLRHSNISFTHVHLDDPSHDFSFPLEWAQDDEGNVIMPHWQSDLSQRLDLAPREQTTRTRFWALSELHGHISPAESLRSYAHLTDWVLGAYLWEADELELTLNQQAALLDISRKSLSVRRSRHKLQGSTTSKDLAQALSSQVWGPFLASSPEGDWGTYEPSGQAQITTPLVKLLNPLFVYRVLATIEKDEKNKKPLPKAQIMAAQRFHLSETVVAEWVKQAGSLMALTTNRSNGRQRYGQRRQKYPLSDKQLNQTYLPELGRCPAPPRSPEQQNDSHWFFQHIIDWFLEAPDDCLESLKVFHDAAQRSSGQVDFRYKSQPGPASRFTRRSPCISSRNTPSVRIKPRLWSISTQSPSARVPPRTLITTT
ncbi:tyrosine-type recombinase/integrase [Halomonas korlensis]|uniref:Phage integrase family protein n=1 Tax=Halomonas korlensis TaxID=463301 RepID=A0A1I7GHT3_9GAMM|nr:tyrosine-type recombinase/integrase [Halomonas korlensis]SFU48020.1 Phage integrase family protein [Halomonas korlensis]